MNRKRVLSLFLALLFCTTLLPTALAEEPEGIIAPAEEMAPEDAPIGTISPTSDEIQAEASSGQCGDNLTWTLDEEGTLTISGTGDMWDFTDDPAPWYSRRKDIKSVLIRSGVTSIGYAAFDSCIILTSVNIPEGVTIIKDWAFYDCNLTSVIIPESVTSIGGAVFALCANLASISIPEGVTSIGQDVFAFCSSLTVIEVDEQNTVYSSLDGVLFDKAKTMLLAYPGGQTGAYEIPESVTSIGKHAFAYCAKLLSVSIPASVNSIAQDVFVLCRSLTALDVDEQNAVYSSLDGVLFNKGMTELLVFPGGRGGVYGIPESVTSIGNSAFWDCSRLTSITIPGNVTSIGDDALWYCDSLKEIRFGGLSPTINEHAFYGVTATAYYPEKDPSWTESVRQNYDGTITWEGYVPGDANGDGELDLLDLVRLRKQLEGVSSELDRIAADLNGNWEIDLPDLVRLRILLVGEPD